MKFYLIIDIFRGNFTVGYSYLKRLQWLCLHLALVIAMGFYHESLPGQSFYRYQKDGQLQITGGIGITKYFGELSNEKQLGDLNPHVSLGLHLPLQGRWAFRPEISYYRISAADADLPDEDSRKNRNLSFRSDNLELSGLFIYELHKKEQRLKNSILRPYVMAGLGITYFNPKALLDGTWHSLPPLYTEGIKYKMFHLVIPAGAGLSVILSNQWKLGLEISYRLSFTITWMMLAPTIETLPALEIQLLQLWPTGVRRLGWIKPQPEVHGEIPTPMMAICFLELSYSISYLGLGHCEEKDKGEPLII